MDNTKKLKRPCKACPFIRATEGGGSSLGGSPPETYIGQAGGPFVLPCHATYDPSLSAKEQDLTQTQQCAGAAIFRANTGVGAFLPPHLHTLPPDKVTVLGTWAEFLAHHRQITLEAAQDLLRARPVAFHVFRELNDPAVKIKAIPRHA